MPVIRPGRPGGRRRAAGFGGGTSSWPRPAPKRALGWPTEDRFRLPDEAVRHFRQAVPRGEAAQAEWQARLDADAKEYPAEAAGWQRSMSGKLPDG